MNPNEVVHKTYDNDHRFLLSGMRPPSLRQLQRKPDISPVTPAQINQRTIRPQWVLYVMIMRPQAAPNCTCVGESEEGELMIR